MAQGWSFSIEKQNIFKKGNMLLIFPTILQDMRYYGTKQLHKLIPCVEPGHDCKIQKTAYGEYFLVVPYTCNRKKILSTNHEYKNPVSVDPGIRKFATTYSPTNQESFMMGARWSTTIMKELLTLDTLYSTLSSNPPNKQQLKSKVKQIRKRVFYLKKELRDQCASFLSKRYDLVMMPKLETGKLVMKGTRRLTTKTCRALLNAGHCKFFDVLKDKCWENGTKFMHVREEYTSQTCPNCGTLNKCGETFSCKNCSFKHDRDIVGAFNIMLKGVRTSNPSA